VELAWLLDPRRDRSDIRGLLALILHERALTAEGLRQIAQRDDLLARLFLYDREGAYRRLWQAPAVLRVDTTPPGAAVRATLSAGGPGRPRQEAALGRAPLRAALAPGLYDLTLTLPGREAVRYPVLLGRGEELHLRLELPRDLPPGMVYVP